MHNTLKRLFVQNNCIPFRRKITPTRFRALNMQFEEGKIYVGILQVAELERSVWLVYGQVEDRDTLQPRYCNLYFVTMLPGHITVFSIKVAHKPYQT